MCPQDVNFDILDVSQENNISEIWVSELFLYNRVVKKMSVSGMGGGDA